MTPAAAGTLLLITWVSISWLAFFVEELQLYLWLRRLGVPVRFIFANNPRYLLTTYAAWCRDHGVTRDERRLSVNRWLRLNFLVSGLGGFVLIFVLVGVQGGKLSP